jgi:hypothetical protein
LKKHGGREVEWKTLEVERMVKELTEKNVGVEEEP